MFGSLHSFYCPCVLFGVSGSFTGIQCSCECTVTTQRGGRWVKENFPASASSHSYFSCLSPFPPWLQFLLPSGAILCYSAKQGHPTGQLCQLSSICSLHSNIRLGGNL